jgi:hypothetical protein
MTHIRFSVEGALDQSLSTNLPVKIMDGNMGLVGQISAGKGAELSAGRYIAQSVLPNGQPVHAGFEIKEGDLDLDVVALRMLWSPDASLAPTAGLSRWPRARHAFADLRQTMADFSLPAELDFGSAAAEKPDAKLQLFAGDPFSSSKEPETMAVWGAGTPIDSGGPRVLRFVRPQRDVWNIHLPVSTLEGVELEFHAESADWLPHVRLPDANAELLLQYLGSHQSGELAQLAENSNELAELGSAQKFERPMLAILGGYVLLKVGDLGRLHDWTTRLSQEYGQLPDAQIVAGEHAARLGRHEDAAALFLRAAALGAPVFRSGLRYSLDRMAAYQAAAQKGKLKTADPGAVSEALLKLGDFADYVNFTRPLVTYTTKLDGSPGRETVDAKAFEEFQGQPLRLLKNNAASFSPLSAAKSDEAPA